MYPLDFFSNENQNSDVFEDVREWADSALFHFLSNEFIK